MNFLEDAINHAVSGYLHPLPIGISFALAGAALVKGIKEHKKTKETEARLSKIKPIKLSGPR